MRIMLTDGIERYLVLRGDDKTVRSGTRVPFATAGAATEFLFRCTRNSSGLLGSLHAIAGGGTQPSTETALRTAVANLLTRGSLKVLRGCADLDMPRTAGASPGVMVSPSVPSRKVRALADEAPHVGWGLRRKHLEKHFWGPNALALRMLDPGGTPDKWAGHLAHLFQMPVTTVTPNGMLDIFGHFPRADGSGTLRIGVRLRANFDGTFDLITVLTQQ